MSTLRTAPQSLAIAAAGRGVEPLVPAEAEDAGAPHGFYVGGHVGYMFGTANATLGDPTGVALGRRTTPYGALFGGVQAGYENIFPSRLMLGIEADVSFPNYEDASKVLSYRATGTGTPARNSNGWRPCAAASDTTSAPGRPSSPAASPGPARAFRASISRPATRTPIRATFGWATCWAAASTTGSTRAGRRAPSISTPTSA